MHGELLWTSTILFSSILRIKNCCNCTYTVQVRINKSYRFSFYQRSRDDSQILIFSFHNLFIYFLNETTKMSFPLACRFLWLSLSQSQMIFDNLLGYSLSISMCMQNFITIVNSYSVQEIWPFSLFQNLELGKASTDDKCHFETSWARSCQYQCLRKSLTK